jgi:Protein of unknown function (DUF3313)
MHYPVLRFGALPLLAALVLAACAAQPVAPTSAELNYEGLVTVPSRRFSRVDLRPGVDFTRYTAVYAQAPELEFRTPDRSARQFPLTEEQKARFRDALVASLQAEFTSNSTLDFVEQAGPEVLSLQVRVIDIAAVVPPQSVGRVGRGTIALEATAKVTFVIEASDSESGELLARGVETRSVTGAASPRGERMLTSWDDIDALCDRWAAASRAGLENLMRHDGS